eukprot:CAMPEP_0174384290 /NCGR_PEP_ID=MMETSP0811_2-20130205/125821_1 /TAXON_ID=73025 ORGANISM="Eutreptiella gymnastica-like, Strain CCMP1594" /NCGR_SAMPLE_ID=MMETSP0811_2 /ASSEMBLY_ACC=CAM_ASM_000667 /LENGTH=125 /DNA_ID=CAMNT_0015538197 /DNA_START=762 /DNA_END=1136 /DNA_ORIENTATION=-
MGHGSFRARRSSAMDSRTIYNGASGTLRLSGLASDLGLRAQPPGQALAQKTKRRCRPGDQSEHQTKTIGFKDLLGLRGWDIGPSPTGGPWSGGPRRGAAAARMPFAKSKARALDQAEEEEERGGG